jgi:hypothetical protein
MEKIGAGAWAYFRLEFSIRLADCGAGDGDLLKEMTNPDLCLFGAGKFRQRPPEGSYCGGYSPNP